MIPYARQSIDEEDIASVVKALRSPWLTTGPNVTDFENAFARFTGCAHAVAVNSGTASLHAAMHVYGVGPGDEVIVPAITFVASSNAVVYQEGIPVFADVDPQALLLDPEDVKRRITPKTKGIIAVDYAGQPCDYEALQAIASEHNLFLHGDACHALGATYKGRAVGSLAQSSSFSFHAVKPITTAEGGMLTTDDAELGRKFRIFRNHGITTDFRERETKGTWHYDMAELGYNYRLSDLQCAMGVTQLSKAPSWTQRRGKIASHYDALFHNHPQVQPLAKLTDRTHAYHLYVVKLQGEWAGRRTEFFIKMRALGVALNVHYRPVYQHSFYVKKYGNQDGRCPVAEEVYENMVSLPIFASMSEQELEEITTGLRAVLSGAV